MYGSCFVLLQMKYDQFMLILYCFVSIDRVNTLNYFYKNIGLPIVRLFSYVIY